MAEATVAFIAYPVSDIPRSVAYYGDVLQLTKVGLESPNWVEFDVAGVTFGVGNFPQIGAPGTAQSLALEFADLQTLRGTLSKQGFESSEPFETPVCWISVTSDPDGNKIILHQAKASA